jgi:hypothetical protein
MPRTLNPFGERSLTIVAAVFRDGHTADRVVRRLRRHADIGDVSVVNPGDARAARKLEPESGGIWRTLLRAHAMFGIAGLLVGFLTATVLVRLGWPPAASSPGLTLLFLAVIGGFLGLIAGGVLTLRPDHDWLIGEVRQASRDHRWTVVTRPRGRRGVSRAARLLRATGARTIRTF